jgi:hypothetical protein
LVFHERGEHSYKEKNRGKGKEKREREGGRKGGRKGTVLEWLTKLQHAGKNEERKGKEGSRRRRERERERERGVETKIGEGMRRNMAFTVHTQQGGCWLVYNSRGGVLEKK